MVCFVVVALTAVAHANTEADKLFNDGKALLKAGKTDEACDAFRRSFDLAPRVGTALNLGNCEEKRGRFATAHAAFTEAHAIAQKKKDRDALDAATARLAVLASKVPQLTVRAPVIRPAGFAVKRDGKAIASADLDREVAIDPGTYELEATADGYVTWKGKVEIAAGQKQVVEIPALVAEKTVAPVTAPPTPSVNVPPTQTSTVAPIVEPAPIADRPVDNTQFAMPRIGIGASGGTGTDGGTAFGARLVVRITDIDPKSSLRAVASGFYWLLGDRDGGGQDLKIFGFGVGGEYVRALAPKLSLAAGLDGGLLWLDSAYNEGDTGKVYPRKEWVGVHVSPAYRVVDALDIGLQFRVIYSADATVLVGELGIDYFF